MTVQLPPTSERHQPSSSTSTSPSTSSTPFSLAPAPAPAPAVEGTPSTVHTISANAAAAAHQHATLFIDARQQNLYAIERVLGAVSYPDPSAPPPSHPSNPFTPPHHHQRSHRSPTTSFIVYDSGSTSTDQPFSRAAAVIDALLHQAPANMRFILLIGGLPALKAVAPALIDSSITNDKSAIARLRAKLSSKPPWAAHALDNLLWSAAPAAPILPPWLYLGGFEDVKRPENIRNLQCTHVLVTAAELLHFQLPTHLVVERIPARDSPDYPIRDHFAKTNAFLRHVQALHDRGNHARVLVHCLAGMSRSATVVIAFLVAHCRMTVDDALQLVRSRRTGVSPNPGFLTQLHSWQEEGMVGDERSDDKDGYSLD